MKAMLLAAGIGSRLRPLTNNCPKCMMPLAGKPLIDWQLRWLKANQVTSCMINLHYLSEKVQNYVGDGTRYGIDIHYSYEPVLLGTAGAVKKKAEFFQNEPFYVIYSDNFSFWNLKKLKEFYETIEYIKNKKTIAIIAVHWRDDVTSSGMIKFDSENRIISYNEKPHKEVVTSNYVNAGFYYLAPEIFDNIPTACNFDFSYQVFPSMIKNGENLYALEMDMPIIGIDTLEAYQRADKLAKEYHMGL